MESIKSKIIISGLPILMAIITGIWLHYKGRPLNTAVFTIHKLISLAAIVLSVMVFMSFGKNYIFSNRELIFIVLTGLLFLITLVSGGFLSFEKSFNFIFLIIHRVSSFLIVVLVIINLLIPVAK